MSGIPTVYGGVNFRSKLEARWAVMFDELHWSWEYEPAVPLAGYIPDFLVRVPLKRPAFARPATTDLVLMEAKPIVTADDYVAPVRKIALSGWEHAAVVLCPTLWSIGELWAIGMATDRVERSDAANGIRAWHPIGISDTNELELGGGRDVRDLWRRAGNKVQWCAPVRP